MPVLSIIAKLRQNRRDRELHAAFCRLFKPESKFSDGAIPVLAYLRSFCFATASTILYGKDGRVDALASAAAQGRQEVWHQIRFYLELNDAELVEMDRWLQGQIQRTQQGSIDAG